MSSKIFKTTLLFLALAELLSIFAWGLPIFNTICFFVILAITLILSIKKLEYGVLILLTELFIGSHGYLFSLNLGETWLSVRIGLFMVIMLTWIIHLFKQGGIKQYYQRIKHFTFFKWYIALGIVIIWSLFWALILNNNFGSVFLDFNNWLYFLILLPIFDIACPKKDPGFRYPDSGSFFRSSFFNNLFQIFTASVVWLSLKTLIILYIFSHNFVYIMPEVYRWIRDTRVGEITLMYDNFYRVFFQSHVYSLFFFFIILIFNIQYPISWSKLKNKKNIAQIILLTISLTTVIISFSRSFWLGLIAGIFVFLLLLVFVLRNWRQTFKSALILLSVAIISVVIIFVIIKIPPYIQSSGITSLIEQRVTQFDAAGSSRINMLKPLFTQIKKHPLLGSGFGTEVTYRSVDPRILQSTAGASGEYTTYAFEWAYLDMILKFGLVGIFFYLGLIFKIGWKLFKNSQCPIPNTEKIFNIQYSISNIVNLGFLFALISLLAVNIFTPYLNHPLGIGFVVLSSIIAHQKTLT